MIHAMLITLKRCSEKKDLKGQFEDFKIWFRKRGYPGNENNSKKVNGVPLLVTYNSVFKNLSQVIRQNLQLLYAYRQVQKVFSPARFVFLRSMRNLKSNLVRSMIYPLERKVGSEECKSKRCLVCLSVSKTDIFQSFQTKEQ